jgi:hypothetical protein
MLPANDHHRRQLAHDVCADPLDPETRAWVDRASERVIADMLAPLAGHRAPVEDEADLTWAAGEILRCLRAGLGLRATAQHVACSRSYVAKVRADCIERGWLAPGGEPDRAPYTRRA